MKNFKLFIILLISGLVVLFVTQNVAVVEIRFMFWQVSMSRSLLIFFTLAVGILAGWMLHSFAVHHTTKDRHGTPPPASEEKLP